MAFVSPLPRCATSSAGAAAFTTAGGCWRRHDGDGAGLRPVDVGVRAVREAARSGVRLGPRSGVAGVFGGGARVRADSAANRALGRLTRRAVGDPGRLVVGGAFVRAAGDDADAVAVLPVLRLPRPRPADDVLPAVPGADVAVVRPQARRRAEHPRQRLLAGQLPGAADRRGGHRRRGLARRVPVLRRGRRVVLRHRYRCS